MEGVIGMHIQRVNGQVVGSQSEALEHLAQSQKLPVSEHHDLVRVIAQLLLDEAQQMLLVHACTVMHMSVHFAHIIEVPVRYGLGGVVLSGAIQQTVQVVFGRQQLEALEGVGLDRPGVDTLTHLCLQTESGQVMARRGGLGHGWCSLSIKQEEA